MMKRSSLSLLIFLFFIIVANGCATGRADREKRVTAKETLGISLIREGRFEAGLKELLEAEELDPENAEIQNAVGLAYRYMGKTEPAISHFQKALSLKPDYPEAENNLGTIYLMRQEWDKAIVLFRKVATNIFYRTPYMAYNNLGYAYHQEGQYKQAIASYKKAVESFSKYSPAYDNMGITYERLQEWDLAIEAYQNAIRYAPDTPVYHLHLGKLYLKLNRDQEAAEQLLQVIKNDDQGIYTQEAKRLLDQVSLSR